MSTQDLRQKQCAAINGYGEPMVLMDRPIPQAGPRDIQIKMRSAEVGDWNELMRIGEWNMERPFPLVLVLSDTAPLLRSERRSKTSPRTSLSTSTAIH